MTKQDWIEAEKQVGLFSHLELNCDGYKLTICEARQKNKIVILFYVNDYFKGEWYNECEERRRFFRPFKNKIYKSKKEESLFRKWAKRDGKEFISHLECYSWHWNSFKAFKNHLIKHNKEITWLNKLEG